MSKNDARAESDRLRAGIREGRFPLTTPTSSAPAEASALTFEQFAKHWRERGRGEATDTQKANEATYCTRLEHSVLDRMSDWAIARSAASRRTILKPRSGSSASWPRRRGTDTDRPSCTCRNGDAARAIYNGPGSARTAKSRGRRARAGARRLIADRLDEKGTRETSRRRAPVAPRKASPLWLKNLIIAALDSCCRRGELLSLQWRDVDLDRGRGAHPR